MKVIFRRDLEGAHEGIDVTTANGTTTSIRFRIASRPETLDGVVDFQHEKPKQTRRPSESATERKQQTRIREVHIPIERLMLEGSLSIPEQAKGIVVFAHGSGSSRHSPRNHFVAGVLQDAGFATLSDGSPHGRRGSP